MWVLKTLFDLGIKELIPVNVCCDTDSAIKLFLDPIFFYEKTKHFEVDLHFVRENVTN